jgi:hypothetical protein
MKGRNMGMTFEGRSSDSPFVEVIWRVRAETDYAPVCPADGHWDLLFTRQHGRTHVSVEGPLTRAKPKTHVAGTEWLVIKFKLGTFMPHLPVRSLLNIEAILPRAASNSFWFRGSSWQFPDFDNVETFVDRLVHDDLLVQDSLVNAVLEDEPPAMSFRTVRRRFLRATGLTLSRIRQIERAQQAAALLEQGTPILDAVHEAGYADQPHMTRSLRRFYGQTPAQIARVGKCD